MPNPITGFVKRLTARRRYFSLDEAAGDIRGQLYAVADPASRAELLYHLADLEHQMASVHPAAFGPAPNAGEGGRDQAESIASGAELVRLLASTEDALVNPAMRDRLLEDMAELPVSESSLWSILSLTVDRRERADLIREIASHAAVRVGEQATTVLHACSDNEAELALNEESSHAPS